MIDSVANFAVFMVILPLVIRIAYGRRAALNAPSTRRPWFGGLF